MAWAVLLGVTMIAGCASDDDDDEFAERFCAVFAPCCAKAGMNGDQSSCRMLYGSARPSSKAAADQCLKDFEELGKDPAFCDFEYQNPDSCEKAFPDQASNGTKLPGAKCSDDDECAGDASCWGQWEEGGGTCLAWVVVPEGAACVGVREKTGMTWSGEAQNNQVALCDGDAGFICSANVCKPRGGVGATCSSGGECVDGAYCDSGKCATKLTAGATCSGNYDECNPATHCAASSKTCEPRRPDGESCAEDSECSSDRCTDGLCKYNPGLGGLALGFVCK